LDVIVEHFIDIVRRLEQIIVDRFRKYISSFFGCHLVWIVIVVIATAAAAIFDNGRVSIVIEIVIQLFFAADEQVVFGYRRDFIRHFSIVLDQFFIILNYTTFFEKLICLVQFFDALQRLFFFAQSTIDVVVKREPKVKQIGFVQTRPCQRFSSHFTRVGVGQILGCRRRQPDVKRFEKLTHARLICKRGLISIRQRRHV